MSERPLRVVIADDDAVDRQRLADALLEHQPLEILATVSNGQSAIDAIRRLDPDLVVLDVRMPGRTGFDVVRTIGVERMPATIFVTSSDDHALEAFDLAATAYILKPIDEERLGDAVRRARKLVELEELQALRERMLALLGVSPDAAPGVASPPPPAPPQLERIAVEMRGRLQVVPVDDIEYVTASGPYLELHVGDRTHLVRESMQHLESRLDPSRFVRIHRSIIVRLDLIETLLRGSGGDYEVQLKTGALLRVSRARREALEQRLGVVP